VSKGVLLFAHNNDTVDYVQQAVFCAKRVKRFLNLPVTLVTDKQSVADFPFDINKYIDSIVYQDVENQHNFRTFRNSGTDGVRDKWFNTNRFLAYELSPYQQTLVLDTDVVLCNSNLLQLFNSNKQFSATKHYKQFSHMCEDSCVAKISLNSVPMYWATIMYFTKSSVAQTVFDTVQHIHNNWLWYKNLYGLSSAKFRNDYAFSIAIHMLQNFTESVTDFEIPYILYNSFDVDIIDSFNDTEISILAKKNHSDYRITYLKDTTVHIMNKFDFKDIIDKDFANDY